ncbi:DUF3299 domain-containing protein [Opitutales bacterium]|nr:DUF3299 domain-containing protein [Opitutales bacterium]
MSSKEKRSVAPLGLKGILLVFTCWSVGYSPESEDSAKQFEFTEVGEPLTGDPIGVPVSNPPKDVLEEFKAPEENTSTIADLNQTGEILEGRIVLGQTLLSTEDNQSLPVINNLPPHDSSSGYEALKYSVLTTFPYEIEWESDGLDYDFSAYSARVPKQVRSLSGTQVAIEGFMVPTVVNEENLVKEFLLMPDQLSCCFGQAPEANGWVVARSESGVEVTMDRVIRILGRLTVEERWDEEFFVGLYHLQCEELIGSDP